MKNVPYTDGTPSREWVEIPDSDTIAVKREDALAALDEYEHELCSLEDRHDHAEKIHQNFKAYKAALSAPKYEEVEFEKRLPADWLPTSDKERQLARHGRNEFLDHLKAQGLKIVREVK